MVRPNRDVSRGVALALVGGALLVLAAIAPWSATAEQSFSGFDHVDGYVTFGIGVAVGVVALTFLAVESAWDWRGRVAAGSGGLAVVALALKWQFGILGNAVTESRFGLHLTLVGGGTLLAAAVVGLRASDSERQVQRIDPIESARSIDTARDGADGDDATDP